MPHERNQVKWIFVTGGVLSGLGKGLVSSSVSKLLQDRQQSVVPLKCDGYLNVDPGTMNPHEHGEVFVLEDGTEVDMDFGHYERFLEVEGKGDWNLTSGKIFQNVIEKEREGEYLGKTVQMVPHVTGEIKDWWRDVAEKEDADIAIIEIGGTVGDMENELYLEAARQLSSNDEEETFLIHTTLVPYLETTGEQKTKPTQHSVKDLRERGLAPDMIVGRSQEELSESAREKISLFCDVPEDAVVSDPDLDTIYRIPLIFDEQNVDTIVADRLDLPERKDGMPDWQQRVENIASEPVARIAICGKYTEMDDSYASVEAALEHAAADIGGSVEIEYLSSEDLEGEEVEGFDGVVIPGGFGSRGVEGKINVIEYCRENGIPLLGLCYGLQLMVVEFARNVLGLDAASQEWGQEDMEFVISEMPSQKNVEAMGGTMRLGAYDAEIEGQVAEIYGSDTATERHRHRYEVDPAYHDRLEENGLRISGITRGGELAEYVELDSHPFFIGTQAHPEFTSTFQSPNPLYLAFMETSAE
ncbi:MAG: glutamine hydrolyzing CTP synthase [Candidatus Nanohaloarchaea archaeon]